MGGTELIVGMVATMLSAMTSIVMAYVAVRTLSQRKEDDHEHEEDN